MFSKSVIDSDMFLDMPLSTQALYFHLAMRADDDGFVNNPKKIARMIGADDDSLKILSAKKFLIPFESGVVVIRHWKIHNYIQKDRYKETVYTDEKSRLDVQKNGMYTECIQAVSKPDASCIQAEDGTDTQVSIGKVSIGKDNNNGQKTAEQAEPVRSISAKTADFERLWALYPRKEGKKEAFAAFQRSVKKGTTVEIMENGINSYIKHIKDCSIERQYIKKGSTYFQQEAWNDVYDDKRSNPVEASYNPRVAFSPFGAIDPETGERLIYDDVKKTWTPESKLNR